jgi:hypothetical protein
MTFEQQSINQDSTTAPESTEVKSERSNVDFLAELESLGIADLESLGADYLDGSLRLVIGKFQSYYPTYERQKYIPIFTAMGKLIDMEKKFRGSNGQLLPNINKLPKDHLGLEEYNTLKQDIAKMVISVWNDYKELEEYQKDRKAL